ncbi:DegT/DnrJ/EryC1/StrS family aminotransferase [Nonomuraea sp. NPDC004297]
MGSKLALLGGEPVLRNPPTYQWPIVSEQDIHVVIELLRRAEISYVGSRGKQRELEERFADYLGVQHALAVNSGTSALHSAYFGIGLEPGDEVLVPSYTFISTVTPLFAVNAVPVLVDVDEWTGNLDPALLEEQITERTRAITVTHINGHPANMPAIMAVARRHGLKVIEDCSLAHGARCAGRWVGTFGDAAAFSLQSNKLVTAGTGGILVTDDDRVHERAILLGHFLTRAEEDVHLADLLPHVPTGWGLNYRIHPVGAALAVESLARLEDALIVRQRSCEHLDQLLADTSALRPPVRQPHMTRIAHYGYRALYLPEQLDGLPIELFVRAIAAEGVPASLSQTQPLHRKPVFQRDDNETGTFGPKARGGARYRMYRDGDLPSSEAYARRVVRLPAYPSNESAAQELFVVAIDKVIRNAGALRDWGRREVRT